MVKIIKHLLVVSVILLLSSNAGAFSFGFNGKGDDSNNKNSQALNPAQVQQVEKIVSQYFINHPDDLMNAFRALQKHESDQQQKKIQATISTHADTVFNASTSPVMGNPKGDVTVVEFMDYRCKHCKDMMAVIKQLIDTDPQVRVVIKQLPIFGGQSAYAAKIALAAQKQDRFQAVHEKLLSAKQPLTNNRINKIARAAGANVKKLMRDIKEDKTIAQQIEDNMVLAQQLSIVGTPAFILGDRQGHKTVYIPGAISFEGMQRAVNDVRHNSNGQTSNEG